MNVKLLQSKTFSGFENNKVQEYDIWRLQIHALQLKKVGEIGNSSLNIAIFRFYSIYIRFLVVQ